MWQSIEKYFVFTTTERRGIFVLIPLIVLIAIFPTVYFHLSSPQEKDQTALIAEAEKFAAELREIKNRQPLAFRQDTANRKASASHSDKKEPKYFLFDPNQIGVAEWMQLGFSEKQAQSIEKYKAHGGRFYKPEDLKKVYVIGDEGYERLAPYIRMAPKASHETRRADWTLDINTADTATFRKLRGIGATYSKRIVDYRERLGGFVSVEQVGEVWGLPDSTYKSILPYLEISDSTVNRMNLNKVSIQRLQNHPYIRYALAKSIDEYRDKNGTFISVDELKKLRGVNDSIYLKILPYVMIE